MIAMMMKTAAIAPNTDERAAATDAAIPVSVSAIFPRWGKYGNAAVIHDWMYWNQSRSRKEADDIFLAVMEVLEVAGWKRKAIYRAVRWFGGFAWRANQRKQR